MPAPRSFPPSPPLRVASPLQLRTELAARGGWTGELDALDAALDELALRQVPALVAIAGHDAADRSSVIVIGAGGVVVASAGDPRPTTVWYAVAR